MILITMNINRKSFILNLVGVKFENLHYENGIEVDNGTQNWMFHTDIELFQKWCLEITTMLTFIYKTLLID